MWLVDNIAVTPRRYNLKKQPKHQHTKETKEVNNSTRTLFRGTIAALLLLGSLVVISAAQTTGGSSSTQNAPASATTTPGTTAPSTTKGQYYNLYLQSLSTNLGVSKDKLTQSMVQAQKDTIAQAVKDGKLTQAQANKLDTRIDAMAQKGIYGFTGLGAKHHAKANKDNSALRGVMTQVTSAVANKLGISVDQLKSDLKSGQTLAQIAQSKNVSVADLKTTIVNTVKPTLDTAVKAGTLTQAQEDKVIQRIQNADFTKKGLGLGHHAHKGLKGSSPATTPTPGTGSNG